MTIRRGASAALLAALLISTSACGSHGSSAASSTTDGLDAASTSASTSGSSDAGAPGSGAASTPSANPTGPTTTGTEVTTIVSSPTSVTVGATTVPAITTPPPPATVPAGAATTTTSTSATSSTPAPPAAALVLRVNGLGDIAFGADPEVVISYVNSVIGPPNADTGWIDPLSLGSCPGTEVRTVTYGDLDLYFGDQSRLAIGRRHFFSYSLGPAADTGAASASAVVPAGMVTNSGIGVGSTVADLRAAYPGLQITAGDQLGPPSFEVSAGLGGLLSGVDDAAVVTSLQGGFGCGE